MWWIKGGTSRTETTGKTRGEAAAQGQASLMRALEPRMLFDGAVAATVAETADAVPQDKAPAGDSQEASQPDTSPAPQAVGDGPRKEVVFVDTRLPDYQELLRSVDPAAEVILLDSRHDGVQQIADALAGRSGIDAIHILSHGDQGVLLLGNAPLFEGNLSDYSSQLQSIGEALSAEGDILLYGCDVGAGDKGLAFLNSLAGLTGADVAASTDSTGGTLGGGNWELEISTGQIATSHALNTYDLQGYDYQLATFSVSTIGELRTALSTSASNGQADTITFLGNISAASFNDMKPSDTDALRTFVDINITDGQTLEIVGGGFSLDANYYGRVLEIRSGDVSISNLTVRDGLVSGNGGAYNSVNGGDALGAGIRASGGTLTLSGVAISGNRAAGGGGNGGGIGYGYGGGGGGGFSVIGGGNGGAYGPSYPGGAGGGGVGGDGGNAGITAQSGKGGSNVAGAGGSQAGGFSAGGNGGMAGTGGISIGGGGGGAGASEAPLVGRGGNAVGGMYIAAGATVNLITTTVTDNLAAGGGGAGSSLSLNAANGGFGVGGIYVLGTLNYQSSTVDLIGTDNQNFGAGGVGGSNAINGNNAGSTGAGGNTGGENLSGTGTINSTYNPNSAPTATNLTQTVAYTEDPGGSVALGDIVVTDPDGSDSITATLSLSNPAAGALTTGTFGSATSTYNGGTGVWTVTGSVSDVNAALAAVAFNPTANWDQDVTITTRVRDAANTGPADGTITLDVTPVNDAPTATNLTQSKAATEGGGAVALDDIVVTDPDTGDTITATLTLSDPAAGTLSTGTFGSATSTYNAGTGVWAVTGSVADVNAALAAVALIPSADNDQNFTITTRIRDAAGTGPADGAISVTVTPVNDAPVVTTSGGSNAFTENGSATVIDAGLTLSDVDNITFASATVAITGNFATGQDLLAFTNDGSTMGNISASYNTATGVLTLTSAGASATLAQWQAALRSVTYSNSSDAPSTANRTISFTVNDGDADSNAATKQVSVTAVNDAPVVTAPGSIGVTEDVATALTGISFSDADAGSSSVTVTFSVGSGSLAAISGGGVMVGGTSSALTLTGSIANINTFIAGSNVSFTTAANATTDVTLTVGIDDGGNTGSGGAQTASETVTLQVTAVNDAPVISAPVSINVDEDVSTALTGISFIDVDAGSGSVTATFSVGSGSLSATSGSGVTVAGSGTGSLTLTGSLADLNAFIAASQVNFLTALNATGNVVLSVEIDDGGNTGSGGAQSDSTTVTLVVTAVNDAPVNSVPGAQSVDQDSVLVFSSGNGNPISVSDVDAGSGSVRVTLTASNGLLTLGGTTGLSFINGSGTADATMTFEGTLADINLALNGLAFSPTGGYNGPASLQIVSNDLGNSGSGGSLSDDDTIAITVNSLNPKVTGVQVTNPDGGYKVGDVITVTVAFDQVVTVNTAGGTPTLLLETGSVDREASYVSGSGSNTLSFSYTVQAGDLSADLDYHSTGALTLNGATIRNATSDDALTTLPALGGADSIAGQHDILIDGVAPTVGSVSVPANGTYVAGENLDFTVNFDEAVLVDTAGGTPRIAITLDSGGTVYASYVSGSGSSALLFRYTVQSGNLDSNGITVGAGIDANGGTLRDGVGNAAVVTLNGVGATAGVLVDAVAPTVASVSVPANGSYNEGEVLSFTVNVSEAVLVNTAGGTPRLALDIGGVTRYADYVSGSGSSALLFQYSVQAGDTDADGIAVAGSLDLNGGTTRDAAGNNLVLALNAVGATGGVLVDTTAPAASGILRLDATPTNAGSVSYTVTFSEHVSGVDAADFSLVTTGTAAGSITSVTQVDGQTYTVVVDGISGTGSIGLNLNGSGTGIADAAGNALTGGLAGESYSVDRDAPTVASVSVPANGTYVAGENLDFTVNFDEAVLVDTAGGTPRIAITLDSGGTVYASYVSGSGSSALLFRYTVQSGNLDSNGITVGAGIDANGGTLRDGVGNAAVVTLNGVGATAGVLVDAVAPTVASVSVPANGSYNEGEVLSFTVNVSEAVLVNTAGGTPRLALDIGGVTRYADYVSGSGSSALLFQYSVQAGDTDADGIAVAGSLDLNGGTTRDAAGNNLVLALNAVGATGGVLVDTTAPAASGILRLDATPTNAGSVSYTVTFSEHVSGVDAADFSLVTTGTAAGSITSVTQVDGQTYTVVVDGISGTGSIGLNLNGSGTGIADAAGNALTGGLAGESYSVDRDAPTVASVSVPANGTYVAGENLDFTVNFDEAVLVDTAGGTPRIAITLDSGGTVYASYVSGSGSSALLFRYTVQSGNLDSNGITVGAGIDANGGTLRDGVGNAAVVTLNGVGATAGVLVDAVAPTVASVSVPANGSYNEGEVLSFTVNVSEAVLVNTAGGTPRLALDIGGVTRYADYVSGSGSSALLFQYSVQAGDTDADGIAVAGSLDLNGGTTRDAAGNNLVLALNAVGATGGVLVDTTAPAASGILRLDATPTNAGSVSYTVTFSEHVSGVDAADFSLVTTGTAAGSITSVTQVDGQTYTVVVDGISGTGSIGLNLNGSGTGIADAAGNALTGGLAGESYSVDRDAPTVASVSVPANGTYVAGENLDFTVNFDEAVLVDTAGGTPRIAITLDSGGTVYASYVSGSGSSALLFRYTVQSGNLDSNGITVGAGIDANGGTLRDGVGNAAVVTLNGVGATAGVLVDAVAPTVASVSVPANGSYNEGEVLSFTVNVSEAVLVNTAGGTPRLALDIGGVTRYADYVSGSGSSALLFQYSVQAGDTDADGIAVAGSLDLNGGTTRDAAGNNLVLALNAVGATGGVLVDTTAPAASGILRLDATPTNAGSVSYTVTFSEHVSGVDAADFSLVTTGTAAGSITSVTQVDGQTYTVVVDGISGTGSIGLNLNGSGTGIADAAGNALTGGLAGESYSVDRDAPTVASVSVPANGTYVAGENLDFTVNFDEAVLVDTAGGTPRIAITLDSGGTVYASYVSGSGSSALLFRYTVQSGNLDSNGITVGAGIDANGGTLRDGVGNAAVVTLNGVGATAGVLVDAVAPTVASVSVPANGSYNEGEVLSFTVNVSEAVLVNTAGGTPRLALDIGGVTRYADYVSGSGSSALLFQYSVQAGDTDADGIAVAGSLDLNGGTTRDAAGNNLVLALNAVGATGGVLVDTTAPAASGILRIDATPTNAGSVSYTVTFSEHVSGVDAADFSLVTTGTAAGSITSVTHVDGQTYTVVVDGISGTGSIGLNLNGSGTGIADAAGNALTGGLAGESYSVDRDAPTVASVSVPANGTYVAGENLDFTVNFDEAVLVDTAGGTPRIAITLDSGGTLYADYLSGSGTMTLVFRAQVGNGQLDLDGISLGSTIDSNGGHLRDAIGNNANITLNAVGDTAMVRVDSVLPTATIVVSDTALAAGETAAVTITFSEAISGLTTADFTVANGVLSGLSSSDGGVTWTATLTPTANITAASNLITLNNTGVVDAAGNSGAGTTDSNLYAIDTELPTATITREGAERATGNTLSYLVEFSENMANPGADQFALVTTGSLTGDITRVDHLGGSQYRVIIGNISGEGSLTLRFAADNRLVDNAGNPLAGSNMPQAYTRLALGGDPEFRVEQGTPQINTGSTGQTLPTPPPPLVVGTSLFGETGSSGITPLGNIFLSANSSAPSYLSQVFSGSTLVSSDVPGNSSTIGSLFSGGFGSLSGTGYGLGGGLGGGLSGGPGGGFGDVFGSGLGDNLDGGLAQRGLDSAVPSLTAQLQQWNEQEQRQQQQLARALAQLAEQQHA
ncbi:DUF4347 domain-containing protein [Zobellella denitrificans]